MRFSGLSFGAALLAAASLISAVAAEDPCAEFAKNVPKKKSDLDPKPWLKCLKNVPFDRDLSLKTLSGLRKILGIQSSTIYHMFPPPELELDAFNLNKTLDAIESKVNATGYKNNWEFDFDVVRMFYRFRDGHTVYEPACTHGFQYTHDYPIVAIANSTTGMPDIYHVHKNFSSGSWQQGLLGNRIAKINGQPAADYVKKFTKESPEFFSFVDPDARWNEMMYNLPAGDSRGRFARRQLWDGEELKLEWANGTTRTAEWRLALFAPMLKGKNELKFHDTDSLKKICYLSDKEMDLRRAKTPVAKVSGQDLVASAPAKKAVDTSETDLGPEDLEKKVKELLDSSGLVPKKKKKKAKKTKKTKKKKPPKRPEGYPMPVSSGPEYAVNSFMLPNDKQTAVLALRKFSLVAMNDTEFVSQYQQFVEDQIVWWKKENIKRLIIDVSGNNGGKVIIPYDLLSQFFPRKAVFTSLNMRWSPTTWAYMKSAQRGAAQELYQNMESKDFKNQTDWLGPIPADGDYFTKRWKQDYMQLATEEFKFDITHNGTQPFKPENIIVLSNGMCASACHSFVEGMQEQGVRTVAWGGRPDRNRTMQAVGGTKGGKVVSFSAIYETLKRGSLNETILPTIGMNLTQWYPEVIPVRLTRATVNSENKFRAGSNKPLEFTITPACQKLSITKAIFDDVLNLWEQARDAAWDKKGVPKKCMSSKPAIPNRPQHVKLKKFQPKKFVPKKKVEVKKVEVKKKVDPKKDSLLKKIKEKLKLKFKPKPKPKPKPKKMVKPKPKPKPKTPVKPNPSTVAANRMSFQRFRQVMWDLIALTGIITG